MPTIRCTKCLRDLSPDEFHRCSAVKSGRVAVCKKCVHLHYYVPNRSQHASNKKAHRATPQGREKEREWQRNRRRAHPITRLLQEARARAKKKGLEFNLQKEDIVIPAVCPILGIPLFPNKSKGACENSPSIDRVNSAAGYIKGNVVVISWRANRIKSNARLDELEKIVEFYRKWPTLRADSVL
jgi:hypothetical protein